jgi:outer membrane protein TolC
LPQAERLLKGTQRDYNAMQESIFRLIATKRQQIMAQRQYIQAQRAHWLAYVRFQQLMSGSIPGGDAGAIEIASAEAGGGGEAGGH